jgi:hypothetical protein
LKVKDKRPSINNRSEQSIYPTQKSVLRTEATPVRSGDETPELIRQHRTAGVRSRKHPNVTATLDRTRQDLEVPWAPLPDPPGVAAIECQTDRLGVQSDTRA